MFDAAIAAIAEAQPHRAEVLPMTPGLVAHIDGDYLAYYASGNDETEPGQARQNAIDLIQAFAARIGAESVVVHNTANGCHKGERYLVATVRPYQGQRKGDRKPKNHAYLQDWLQSYEGSLFLAKNWTSREADDGIAACAHFAIGKSPGYAGIATRDKDLRMLPGLHVNWMTRQVTRVEPGDYEVIGEDGKLYGLKWFFAQMLMGDDADHCPGLERYLDGDRFKPCGEKTALKLLAGCASTEDACRAVMQLYRDGYRESGATYADDRFCEQAALLWMRLGNEAPVADFARHAGFSRINHAFDPALWAAVERLEERVSNSRKQIDAFGSGGDPPAADCGSGG
jgi:DNA polymerase-1